MGCGSSQVIGTQALELTQTKCLHHPSTDASYFDKKTKEIICNHCRRSIREPGHVVGIRAFVNSTHFNEMVSDTQFEINKEMREVRKTEGNLHNIGDDFKKQISDYIEDIIKQLRQLKSILHYDAEVKVSKYKQSLQNRFNELAKYNSRFRAYRSRKTYEEKLSLLRICSDFKHSTSVDLNLTYELENNSKIEEWQARYGMYLQPPYPESTRSFPRRSSPGSADSGHLQIGFGAANADGGRQSKGQITQHSNAQYSQTTEGRNESIDDTRNSNCSRKTGGPISTARLSKVNLSSELQCVKTQWYRDRKITCTGNSNNGCVVFCDQRNSELLLLDSNLTPLRSKHLSGRPGMVGSSDSMRRSEWMVEDFSRRSFQESTLSYDGINNPKYFAVDNQENIYVVESDSSMVHWVSGAGVYRGVVVMEESNINHISYLPHQEAFLVVSHNGERVDVYKGVTLEDI